jgi:hypothetical protein
MKKRPLYVAFLTAIAIIGIGVVAAHADDAFKSLAQGVEYRHDVRTAGPLSIHVLRIDRQKKWDLETGLGQGSVYGLEPLDGIVARVVAVTKKPAVAAINGDFFVIKPGPYQGDPCGLQITQGELVSRPMGSSFWVTPKGELKIGPAESKLRVIWPDGKAETPLGLNEVRPDNEATLYTPTLGLRPMKRRKSGRQPARRVEKNSSLSILKVNLGSPFRQERRIPRGLQRSVTAAAAHSNPPR